MLRCFKHKNILAFKEVFESEKSLYLITEYLEGPNLVKVIAKHQQGFSRSKSRKLFRQLIKIKQQLDDQNIMHRDIKPENIMFRDQKGKELVLIDFGLAAHWDEDYLFPRCGTPGYVAPEVICNVKGERNFDGRCDMFSIGCVMHQIFLGEPLFQGKNLEETIQMNKAFSVLDIQGNAMKKLLVGDRELLRYLLEKEPENRLTIEQALRWKWEIVDDNKIQSLQKFEEQSKPVECVLKCEKEINSNKKFEEEKKWINSNNSISKQAEFSLQLQAKNPIFGCLNINTKPNPIKNQQLLSLISPGLLPKKPKLNRTVYRHGTIQKDYVICEKNDERKEDNKTILFEYQ